MVVDTSEGVVVVEASNVRFVRLQWKVFIKSPDDESVVTCAEQHITPRNPLAVDQKLEVNSIVMIVPALVKGPGIDGPRFS